MPRSATANINSKKEAGQARKAEQKKKVDDAANAQLQAAEASSWQAGAKSTARTEAAAAKADEAARKKREKAELLAQEEEELGNAGASKAKKAVNAAKKGGKKKKDELSMLEDALQSSADKSVKKKRAQEQARKQKEAELAKKKAEQAAAASQQPVDPLLANTEAQLGSALSEGAVGRAANKAQLEGASGIDAALDDLKLKGSTPVKAKALFAEFEAKMLPIVKNDYPGLRLSQYKEKVFALWKKSPENPANMVTKTAKA